MTWELLKAAVQNHRFEITKTGAGKRDWVFASVEDDPIADITFETLGAGTNKMAVRVAGRPWVLLFGKSGRQVERTGFAEEVEMLKALAALGLTVPAPFNTAAQAVNIFDITVWNDGEEPAVPAFFQEFMSRDEYLEMEKSSPRARDEFARHSIVTGGRVPATIATTLADLERIKTVFTAHPWGDFQIMYEKRTGRLIVFDPLRSDPNRAAYLHTINTWLKDINDAIEARDRHIARIAKIRPTNFTGGAQERRHSIG